LQWIKKTYGIAVIVFIAMTIIFMVTNAGVMFLHSLNGQISEFRQIVLGISLSFILFPLTSLSIIDIIINRAREIGITISMEILNDYIYGSITVFLFSLAEQGLLMLSLVAINATIIALILSAISAQLIVLIILISFIGRAISILYGNISS
jgi:hypothetical protein